MSVLPEADQMIRRQTRWTSMLLHHSHPSSHSVYLPSVALKPHHCTDKGARVATANDW